MLLIVFLTVFTQFTKMHPTPQAPSDPRMKVSVDSVDLKCSVQPQPRALKYADDDDFAITVGLHNSTLHQSSTARAQEGELELERLSWASAYSESQC